MKTNVKSINVVTKLGGEDHIAKVPIATADGTLMMNRLRRELRFEADAKTYGGSREVEIPNSLVLSIADAYCKKSKAMRRKDRALDMKSEENSDWKAFACELYSELCTIAQDSRELLEALANSLNSEELLAQITMQFTRLEESTECAEELIHMIEDDETAPEEVEDFE